MNLQLAEIYDGYEKTPKGGKKIFGKGKNSNKDVYKIVMERFFEKYGPSIEENCRELEAMSEEDRAEAMKTYGRDLLDRMEEIVLKKPGKRFPGGKLTDVTFFTVMYVFPTVTYVKHDLSPELAYAIRDEWAARYRNPNIEVSHYTEIYEAFDTRLFGFL